MAPTVTFDWVKTSAGTTHWRAMPTRLAPNKISAMAIARFKECKAPAFGRRPMPITPPASS